MAFIFGDTFDHYATAELTEKWTKIYSAVNTGAAAISAGNGRHSSQCARFSTTNIGIGTQNGPCRPLGITLLSSGATCIVGFSFRTTSLQVPTGTSGNPAPDASPGLGGNAMLLYIRQLGTTQVHFRLNTNGTISAYRNGTLLGTSTAGNPIQAGVTSYLEFKVLLHASAGTIDIKIDGLATILSLTGQNTLATSSATWDELVIGQTGIANGTGGVNITFDYDDFYVCDGSGTTSNDFLGDTRGDLYLDNAAGDETNWTPDAGNNYQRVNETLIDGDTSYVAAVTAGTKDTYKYPTQPVIGADVLAVQVCMGARKTDAGGAGLKAIARISGVDYLGTELAVPSSYAFIRQVWDRRPSDGNPWVDADFGPTKTQFGIDKST